MLRSVCRLHGAMPLHHHAGIESQKGTGGVVRRVLQQSTTVYSTATKRMHKAVDCMHTNGTGLPWCTVSSNRCEEHGDFDLHFTTDRCLCFKSCTLSRQYQTQLG